MKSVAARSMMKDLELGRALIINSKSTNLWQAIETIKMSLHKEYFYYETALEEILIFKSFILFLLHEIADRKDLLRS